MLELIASVAVAGLIGWSMTDLLMPLVSRLARLLGAIDYPGGRKQHEGAVPRLGGLAIVTGLVLGVCPIMALGLSQEWRTALNLDVVKVLLMIFSTMLIFILGLVDDLSGISAGKKFLIEFLAAYLVVSAGWRFEGVEIPGVGYVNLGILGWVATIIWIVGVTNAINLIDGLHGLAGGVVAIVAGSLAVYSIILENIVAAVLMSATVGACLGFLHYNWKGEIFMGDTGSLTLGFILAVSTVHASMKTSAAVAILVPILALGVPVMDTLLVMALRYLSESDSPTSQRIMAMFQADRNHLHHLLESFGGRKAAVFTMYGIVLLFSVLALVTAATKRFSMGVALVIVELVAIFVVRQLGFAARMREINWARRAEIAEALRASLPGRSRSQPAAAQDDPPTAPDE